MDNNEDILEIRDSQQREDEVPAWTHPAFADAVRATDLTRNQYLQLAAHRRAQQSQQSQQQIPQPYHWQTPQQSHQQNYQRSYQPGHQQSPSHGHQQSYQPGHQQSQSHSHPHGHQQSHQQSYQQQQSLQQNGQQLQQQDHQQSHSQGHPHSHQQSYQQQQHYSRMETLQTFQNQHHQHRQSPAPVLHFPENSNKAFSPSQFGQPQSATIAQPPRPSTERSISDSREEYVRPSDIGPSMSHHGAKPLRQTSVPVTTQAQAPSSMQATTGENSVQPATQSQYQVAHNRPLSNPRSTNSSHSTQGRILATFHPEPSIAPPRSDVARDQRQQVPPAKAKEVEANFNDGRPVAKPQSTKHHGKSPADTAMNTENSPKRDPYNSATRTTINIRPEDQDQVNPKNSSSTPNKPPQDPIHSGLYPASHLPANTSPSAISTQPPPTATTTGYSTKASHRASPGQSALAELNRFKAKGSKNSDVQARNSPGPPHPVQQARNHGQSPPLNAPHAPLQRSASVPQQAHNSMQTASHSTRMPAIGANESATPSSQRDLPVNSQATRDENLSRDHYSHTPAESQPTSSTPLSEAPPKQISQVISNALPSINRDWNRWTQPEKLPAQNGAMPPPPPPPRGGQPPVGRAMPESMPPPKVRRLEDGSKQGKSLKAIHPENHLKKIRQGTSLKQRNDLIQPFDSNQADSRDAYDPATIARDVLIVASKHPTEERLNHHLAVLMKSFPSVDASKDLATLRWDLIDPVIPRDSTAHRPPACVATQPISAPSSLFPNRVEYRPSPQYLPPSLPVSAQSHYPGPIPFQHRPISWAPVAISGPPPPPPPLPFPPPPFSAPQAPPLSHYAPAPKPKPGPKPTPKAPKQPKVRKSQGPAVVKATPPPTPAVVIDLSPRPKGPVESPRTQKTPSVAVVIDSPRRMDPIKRRGRPKKDDKGTDAEGSAASGKKSHPEYPVFNCQWEKCQAQLHNLSVLQDHALKIHIPHNIMCGWKDCKNKTPMAAAAMWEHVLDSHIKNLAWTHGDGPAVSAFAGDNNEPPELSMSSFPGLNRNARPGTVILPAESQVVNAYSRVHGISNTKDKAVLLKEAGCRWKEDTGPDVDFSDCRLAIPTRLSSSSVVEFAVTSDSS